MNRKAGNELLLWYRSNKRDLPWRKTRNPYLIWVSEVILQQTRVDQGLSYYLKFVERFPTIEKLAEATEDEVLKYWQGLGYYSRARNLHSSAKQICKENNGVFPANYNQILKLKGIGRYTAAAIASIAFNQAYPVVDGNVSRVVARLFGIKEAVNSPAGLKKIEEKLDSVFIKEDPGNFNQAIMELGALVCKPAKPDCFQCVWKSYCIANKQDKINEFPVKIKSKIPDKLYLYYFVLRYKNHSDNYLYLRKRGTGSIWKNLYDFPCFESDKSQDVDQLVTEFNLKNFKNKKGYQPASITGPVNHQLTHKSIRAYFLEISVNNDFEINMNERLQLVEHKNLDKFPVPKLIENYIKSHILTG